MARTRSTGTELNAEGTPLRSLAKSMLRAAALAPPAIKTKQFERACAKLVQIALGTTNGTMRTNLGISPRLRCTIPIAKTPYVFGRPQNMLSERATLALVRELSCDCRHFVDVGANEGLFTFLLSQATTEPPLQLHWFEPDADLYSRLIDNLAANGITSSGHHVAVSDRNGVAAFYKNLSDDASGSLSSYFAEKHETRLETVVTIKLRDYLTTRQIADALVKIDVEGAGYQVWRGVSGEVNRIKYLIIEMLAPEIEQDLPAKITSDAGLYAYYIKDFQLEEARLGSFHYVEPFWNWMFCRLRPTELSTRLGRTKFRVLSEYAKD